MGSGFLQQKGGYRSLRVYKLTEVIYDLTYCFCSRFLRKGDRTVDQMIQAARSGKQNIAEGSMAATTSAETEIKLTNVALASLEELLLDYEDYLRVRRLPHWDSSHSRYVRMRRYVLEPAFLNEYQSLGDRLDDEELANLCITLICQATVMLRRLVISQQEMFLKNCGVREQMTRARLAVRSSRNPDPSDPV